MNSPQHFSSPIGMLQPGGKGQQGGSKNTKSGKTTETSQPQNAVDMTASLKNMLGIGGVQSDSGVESAGNSSKNKKANAPLPVFDSSDFPSLGESSKK
eukprot:CAMPEP_0176429120 /NCGR_PEP_ID=MMETSP0127-20121128/13533_1 /TAXON_ID=938130 /ORGANISM="Platyophrya macrostoma, Strain WH" /LENGTH=97 /DNA_ID=CAMNT_0017810887 /DNA_START=30 /DNA_END=323 /DNA_ORIENTATION=+